MGKRQETALLTKQKLLDAMKELLKEKSADDINIEDVTTKAGVAKGSFYTHFKRKEDLISVIAYQKYDVIKQMIMTSADGALDKLSTYLTESAKIIEANTLEIAQNWMKSVVSPLPSETVGMDKYQYDRDAILEILKKAVVNKEFDEETPVEEIVQTIMDSYYGAVAIWCMTSGEIKLIDNVRDFCNGSLRTMLEKYLR